jgi:hypothetical protein
MPSLPRSPRLFCAPSCFGGLTTSITFSVRKLLTKSLPILYFSQMVRQTIHAPVSPIDPGPCYRKALPSVEFFSQLFKVSPAHFVESSDRSPGLRVRIHLRPSAGLDGRHKRRQPERKRKEVLAEHRKRPHRNLYGDIAHLARPRSGRKRAARKHVEHKVRYDREQNASKSQAVPVN